MYVHTHGDEDDLAGERTEETNVMIGVTALVHDYPVVTRNVGHFERIDGLDVVSY